MSPTIFTSITNIPAQTSLERAEPERKSEVSYEAAIEEVSTRVITFFACTDFRQLHCLPGYLSLKAQKFDPEQFNAMLMQAFRVPGAEASKEEVQAIIDAKRRLKIRLEYLERMFSLFEAAGLDDYDVGLSLAWLGKLNQESYSELNAGHPAPF